MSYDANDMILRCFQLGSEFISAFPVSRDSFKVCEMSTNQRQQLLLFFINSSVLVGSHSIVFAAVALTQMEAIDLQSCGSDLILVLCWGTNGLRGEMVQNHVHFQLFPEEENGGFLVIQETLRASVKKKPTHILNIDLWKKLAKNAK